MPRSLSRRSDFGGGCFVHVQSKAQCPLYTVTQLLVLDCEDRESCTARTTFSANRDIRARGEYLRNCRSSNIGRTLASYVQVVWPGLRLADHVTHVHC